jgi:hypothetical protein
VGGGIAFATGYTLRTLAVFRGWEEPLPQEVKGVVIHGQPRPLLGRKPLRRPGKRALT